jgi:hypothetical protein
MYDHDLPDGSPLLCARCGAELAPGKGNYYVVRIEALADPTPPSFTDEDLQRDPREEIERLPCPLTRRLPVSPRPLIGSAFRTPVHAVPQTFRNARIHLHQRYRIL